MDFTDPALSYYTVGWQLEYATCAKLVNYPDVGGGAGTVVQPEVARALPTVSDDGLTYTFELRSDFAFNTGEHVTGETAKHTFERLLNPATHSPSAPFYTDIVGAQAMLDGAASSLEGLEVSGQTVTFHLTRASGSFLARLAMPFACLVPRDLPVAPSGVDVLPSAGPYFIESRVPRRQIVLQRNPNYHGSRPANYDTIVYTIGM